MISLIDMAMMKFNRDIYLQIQKAQMAVRENIKTHTLSQRTKEQILMN